MTIKKMIHRICTAFFMLLYTALFSAAVEARQLDDVTLPDSVTIDGTDVALQLNGMGYRTKFVFDIYVGGLYTESSVKSRDEAQALNGPKRVVMHMVFDEVEREKITALISGTSILIVCNFPFCFSFLKYAPRKQCFLPDLFTIEPKGSFS